MTDIEKFIQEMPKAELHMHIEGSLEPELMFTLARRNGLELPNQSVAAVHAAYQFRNLQDFLDLYYRGMSVLREAQDFYDLTWTYLRRAKAHNVRHAEIFFDPQAHTSRGVPLATVVDGVTQALDDGRRKLDISSRLIMCFLRHLSEDDALQTLQAAMSFRDRIVGVGLDSTERGHPPGDFARAFRAARAAGFRAVAHAGEEGPATYVRDALDILEVERIDHGVRALDDPHLVTRLAQARIPLTVCPLSNLRLGVVGRMADHPLAEMLKLNLVATINSDDPAYFGGYVVDNYRAVQTALDLGRNQLLRLARNSFEAAFLEPAQKEVLLAQLDEFSAQHRKIEAEP